VSWPYGWPVLVFILFQVPIAISLHI
jgi:hypothetical protein